MFRKSQPNQGKLFNSISGQVSSRKQKMLDCPTSWHNIFYKEVVCRIDESVFSVLYSEGMGRPNVSIRVLLGMMILKEGNGWSDEQLFEECRFNLKVMLSLGYQNMDEDTPVESTYYLFRKLLTTYSEQRGGDLIKESFQQITKEQIGRHNVRGKKVRIDSKLINSNIALCTRVDLVLEGVRKFVKGLDLSRIKEDLLEEDYKFLQELKLKTTTNATYNLNKAEKGYLLKGLGAIIKQLLESYEGAAYYEILKRIYQDQYTEQEQTEDSNEGMKGPQLKAPKEVSSSSVQSVHDPQATYRSKGQGKKTQNISGFHANVVETCDETNEMDLIVDVMLEAANVNENEFLLPSIQAAEQVLKAAQSVENKGQGKVIEHATTDGGYDSNDNRKAMSEQDMPHWNMGKGKGKPHRFHLSYDEQGKLQAYDKKTNQNCQISYSEKLKKYVIIYDGNKRRYMTPEQVDNYLLLQKILSALKPEDARLRANVESTIHQAFHRLLKRNKIKYRGMYKCNMYVISRALWTNFRRISKKMAIKYAFSLILKLWHIVEREVSRWHYSYVYLPHESNSTALIKS